MTCAIGGRRPIWTVVPLGIEHDGIIGPTQFHATTAIGQRANPWPEHTRGSIDGLHISGYCRND